MSDADALTAALGLADRGWAVFPVGLKAPFKGTRGFKDATKDQGLIIEAWRRRPNANVAVRTGRASGIVVLDIDPRHGGDDALHELEREYTPLPETVTATTGGGGAHYYFRHPIAPIRTTTIRPGVDVRAENAYVVAPPSVHESGRRYAWDLAPEDTDPAEAPEWLSALLTASQTGRFRVPVVVTAGERNATAVRLVGALVRAGLSPEAIHAALAAQNCATFSPPLGDDEISRIAKKASAWESPPWSDLWTFLDDDRLSAADRLLLVVLAFSTRSDLVARVGHRGLHLKTGIRRASIPTHLKRLERAGRIEILEREGRGAYRVLPMPPSGTPGVPLRPK